MKRSYHPTGISRTCDRYDLDEPATVCPARAYRTACIGDRALDPSAGSPTMGSCIDWDAVEAANRRSRAGRKAKGVVRGVVHAEETP